MSVKESVFFYNCYPDRNKFIEDMARYLIDNEATVRKTALRFGISKSTVHKNLTVYLKDINQTLFSETEKILQKNKSERHLRGGLATKKKYMDAKK